MINENSLVTIIVPVYNVHDYLEECCASLRAQTYQNFECLLVDDGSTDGSGALCDQITTEDERFRVIHKENGGLSDARNAGLDAALGEYIAFVDSDDTVERNFLSSLLAKLMSDNLDVSVGKVLIHDVRSCTTRIYSPLSIVPPRGVLDELWNTAACNKLYRKCVFEHRRFIKGIKFEDMPMWTDILFSGARIGYVDEYVYRYNVNRPGSIVTAGDYRQYPFAWECQYDGLQRSGRCSPQIKSDFCARVTMKFIQAYNRSRSTVRNEFFIKTKQMFKNVGKISLSHEYSLFVSLAVLIHTVACRNFPFWLYSLLFWPERIILNPRLNDFLRRNLQS